MPRKKIQRSPEYEKWLRSLGYTGTKAKNYKPDVPDLTTDSLKSDINGCGGLAAKTSIDDYKWKKERRPETFETKKAIERKAKSVAPHYSKGPSQYITPGTDPKTIGKKV